jgi:hypothetical protein
MDIRELAEKFIEAEHQAGQTGNLYALEQIESPSIVIHMPPAPDFNGFEAHKQYIETGRESATDIQQEWGYITGDGNVAVVSLNQKVTLKKENPIFKIPAGSTVKSDSFFVLRGQNDRIAEIWIHSSYTIE